MKISRIVPRRSLAQEFCEAGMVEVNGLAARSGKDVRAGDTIRITRRDRTTCFQVKLVPESKQLSRSAATELYDIVSEIARPSDA